MSHSTNVVSYTSILDSTDRTFSISNYSRTCIYNKHNGIYVCYNCSSLQSLYLCIYVNNIFGFPFGQDTCITEWSLKRSLWKACTTVYYGIICFRNWHGIFIKVNLLMDQCMKLSNYIICWQLNMWFN